MLKEGGRGGREGVWAGNKHNSHGHTLIQVYREDKALLYNSQKTEILTTLYGWTELNIRPINYFQVFFHWSVGKFRP